MLTRHWRPVLAIPVCGLCQAEPGTRAGSCPERVTAPRPAGRGIFSVPKGAGLAGEGLLEERDEAGQGFPSTPSPCQPCLCPPAHALQPSQELVLSSLGPGRQGWSPLGFGGTHVAPSTPSAGGTTGTERAQESHRSVPSCPGSRLRRLRKAHSDNAGSDIFNQKSGKGQLRREREGRGGAGSSCRLQFPHISRSEPCAHRSGCAVPGRVKRVGPTARGPRGVRAASPDTGTGQGRCRSTKSRLACSEILWLSRKYIPGQPPIRPQPDRGEKLEAAGWNL